MAFFATLPSLDYIYTTGIIQESAETSLKIQPLLKTLSSFTFQRLFTFQTLLLREKLLNPHKNPVF